MQPMMYYCAVLTYIDEQLDDYKEDLGDLPDKLNALKNRVNELQAIVDETTNIYNDVKDFTRKSKTKIAELKAKEEELSKKQFKVRNNKEFDAITTEIETTRDTHNNLIDEMRNAGVKQENLQITLEQQQKDVEEAIENLKEKQEEFELITSGQNQEVKDLYAKREKYEKMLTRDILMSYERIRTLHRDAAVKIRKNSCSGCFSAVPPQQIVEIRNNPDDMFTCEQCGRILVPEEIEIDEDAIDEE